MSDWYSEYKQQRAEAIVADQQPPEKQEEDGKPSVLPTASVTPLSFPLPKLKKIKV